MKKWSKRMGARGQEAVVVDGDRVRCHAGSIKIPGHSEPNWFQPTQKGGNDGGRQTERAEGGAKRSSSVGRS